MSIKIAGGVTGVLQEVGSTSKGAYVELRDTNGNPLAHLQREFVDQDNQEGVLIAGKNDEFVTMFRVDRKGNTMMGNYNPELIENFEGATVNVQKWTPASTTFVPAQTTLAGYNINSTSLTTLSAVSILQSQRLFYKLPRVPLQLKTRLRHSMVSGTIADFGWGVPATTTLIVPNGTCFRFTNSGNIKGVITYNSVEIAAVDITAKVSSNGNTAGTALNMSNSYYTSNYFVYDVVIDDDNAVFTIQDTTTGEMVGYQSIPVPIGYQKMWGATALPIYYRMYNNTAPASFPVFIITELQCLSLDMTPPTPFVAGNLGLTAGRNPFTGAQLENHTNSTAPTSATLSNTAAGYSTLGGRWQFAAVVGAVTDYALFALAIPAGSKFLCEGIRIESYNTVVAVATTATVMEWSMGFNSSAVSLATSNIIRRQIGVQTFPVGATVGAAAAPLDVTFTTPEVVESGRFIHVILNMPIGTATATEIFRGTCHIKGRFI
jgi:hypothetical protein